MKLECMRFFKFALIISLSTFYFVNSQRTITCGRAEPADDHGTIIGLNLSNSTSKRNVQRIHAKNPSYGYIISNRYPLYYGIAQNCEVSLMAPPSSNLVIAIKFIDMDLAGHYSKSNQCLREFIILIITDRYGRNHPGERICGQKVPDTIQTMQSKIRIIFVSPGGTQPVINRRGFKLRYEFTPEYMISAMPSVYNDPNNNYIQECGGQNRADELSGIIKSPGFPKTYPKNVVCNWLIRVEPNQRIYIRLLHLALSTTVAECDRASLKIIDGYRHENVEILSWRLDDSDMKFCGGHLYYNEEGMKSYLSVSNRVIISNHPSTDQLTAYVSKRSSIGFKLLWTQVNSLVLTSSESPGTALAHTNDLTSSPESSFFPVIFAASQCSGFLCKGGEFCIDNGQNVCAERTRLCINESLLCDGISNCAENDESDEQHCYSSSGLHISILAFACLAVPVLIVFCLYYRNRHSRTVNRQHHEPLPVECIKNYKLNQQEIHVPSKEKFFPKPILHKRRRTNVLTISSQVAAYEKSKLLELEMAHVKRSPRHKETTIRPITTLSDALLCSEPISAENSAKLNSKDICELTLNYCELFPCSCEPPTLPITPPLESGEENAQMAVQNGRVDNEEIVWKLLQNVNDNKLVIM